ncbi:helix-turn-helix transcriptional regulator [Natroniella sp. ANB-PHB2]|uniref:helix-turn-helix transcriptional regulator n=1 Tax=Natroniella sp. ANB-PHB2 TaxID=3384444 RepID=UPI0038D48905
MAVSTTNLKMKQELIAITLLLRDKIINDLDKSKAKKLSKRNNKIELSVKQIKVLKNLCRGLTTKEIANKLHCSKSTVKYHKRIIFEKLNVNSTPEMIVEAIKVGLICIEEI